MAVAELKQMRKGTKSCRECRRRKIKCTWPDTPPTGPDDQNGQCNECSKSDRECLIQGQVNDAKDEQPSKRRIYKRRRDTQDDAAEERPSIRIQVDRSRTIVERTGSGGTYTPDAQRTKSPSNDWGLVAPSDFSDSLASLRFQDIDPAADDLSVLNGIETNPLLSQLFNNELLSPSPNLWQQPTSVSKMAVFPKEPRLLDIDKLRSVVAAEPFLLDVLDVSTHWWIAWRDQDWALHGYNQIIRTSPLYKSVREPSKGETDAASGEAIPVSLRDFVQVKLSSSHPVTYAAGLLCIAMSLEQLRPGVDDFSLKLSARPAEIIERIVAAVDAVILSTTAETESDAARQSGYRNDPEILLLFMQRAKIFAESGQLRKSWLMARETINTAKRIGFTDAQSERDEGALHRQRFVGSTIELDRMISMILGVPYARDEKFTDRLARAVLLGQGGGVISDDINLKMRALRRIVAVACERVNDRNAAGESDEDGLRTTMAIQARLDLAYSAMPEGWWRGEGYMDQMAIDPLAAYEHLIVQMWFWEVQAILQLPFMLKSTGLDSPYEQNRSLCLQGCRGMVRIFTYLRSNPSLSVYICACEDFQGILTACILMIGMLMRISNLPPRALGAEYEAEMDRDLGLVEDLKEIFRYRANMQGGAISRQGVKVLQELQSFFEEGEARKRVIILPHFGAITLDLKKEVPKIAREARGTGDAFQDVPTAPSADVSLDFGSVNAVPAIKEPSSGSGSYGLDEEILGNSSLNFLETPDLDFDNFLFGDELDRDWNVDFGDFDWDDHVEGEEWLVGV